MTELRADDRLTVGCGEHLLATRNKFIRSDTETWCRSVMLGVERTSDRERRTVNNRTYTTRLRHCYLSTPGTLTIKGLAALQNTRRFIDNFKFDNTREGSADSKTET